jgi:hypothetical protein
MHVYTIEVEVPLLLQDRLDRLDLCVRCRQPLELVVCAAQAPAECGVVERLIDGQLLSPLLVLSIIVSIHF